MGRLLLSASVASLLAFPAVTRASDPDGLQRFEKLLPALQAELKKDGGTGFRYARGTAIGSSGFALDDVTIDVPADKDKPDSKPSKATIKRILVEDLDFDRIEQASQGKADTGPYFAKLKVQGLAIDGAMQDQVKGLGVPDTSLDLALDYRYDDTRHVLMLNKLGLDLTGLASLTLSMILDDVPQPGMNAAKQAEDKTTLRTATLTYDDRSLLGRTLPIAATMTGMEVDQGIALLRTTLGAMLQGQSKESQANADALISYAMDWQAPKGPLEIRLTPAANANYAELKKIDTPDAAQKILGLAIAYGGTRAGIAMASAATGGAAAAAGPAKGAAAALCTANSRVFVRDKDDGTLTAATVLEATSGGRCVVRLDGAAKGDDTVAAAADLRRWSVDGPGEPLAACEKGKSVIALSDGTWTPGKIKSSGKDGKCEVKFEGDDDSQSLPLNSIRTAGD